VKLFIQRISPAGKLERFAVLLFRISVDGGDVALYRRLPREGVLTGI
jgi:hypothetical protein